MLDGKNGGNQGGDGSRGHAGGFGDNTRGFSNGFGGGASSGGFGDDLDDDIPFVSRDSIW